jgi:hypothetical protein
LGLPGRAESQKQTCKLCKEKGGGSKEQEIKKDLAIIPGVGCGNEAYLFVMAYPGFFYKGYFLLE